MQVENVASSDSLLEDADEFNISYDIIGDDINSHWTVIISLEAVSELTQQCLSY